MRRTLILSIFMALVMIFHSMAGVVESDSQPLVALYDGTDSTWAAGDTIYITHNLTVQPDTKLTIEPGVHVIFTGHYTLNVEGLIDARGTEQDSIFFTTTETDSGWLGIHIEHKPTNSDTSFLSYCHFENVNNSFTADSLYNGAVSAGKNTSLCIEHSFFTQNKSYKGGAFYAGEDGTRLIFENNIFADNEATYGGAVFCSAASQVSFTKNIFRGNSAVFGGAAFYENHSWVFGEANEFVANRAGKNGGAQYISESSLSTVNELYAQNSAEYGGALSSTYSSNEFYNCTFADNSAGFYGGAFYITFSSSATLVNSILWGNTADSSGTQVYFLGSGTQASFEYCDVQGDSSEFSGPVEALTYMNNISQDALFSYEDVAPYSLTDNSPCLNAGAPDSCNIGLPETDIAGHVRVQDGRVDMGAYEGVYTTGLESGNQIIPQTSKLYPNYPNPFNPSTTIAYDVKQTNHVRLRVYNMLGQLVKQLADERQEAGRYKLRFNARNMASGVYFYQLKVGSFVQTRKMILLR